jgi:hypothetical protein
MDRLRNRDEVTRSWRAGGVANKNRDGEEKMGTQVGNGNCTPWKKTTKKTYM